MVRENYNSFKYWDKKINENKTIRGHMFMDSLPNEKSIYIHSLIFSKGNGINNIFAYFPDEKALLGYIQYSFLQEAFYKWIYGKNSLVTKIPSQTVEKIVKDGLKNGRISRNEAKLMLTHYEKVSSLWSVPKERIVPELIKFSRTFNKTWYGNNKEFLYLKILKSSEDLAEFVIDSALIIGREEEFEKNIGLNINEWKMLCSEAPKNSEAGERLKTILEKKLTEII